MIEEKKERFMKKLIKKNLKTLNILNKKEMWLLKIKNWIKLPIFIKNQALVYFDYTFPKGDQEEQKYNLLLEQCNNNMVQCKLLQGSLDEAWNYSHQALKINPKSEKAIFRQAKISFQKDDFAQCETLLQKLNQDLQETKKLKLNLQNRIKLYNQRNEQVYKKMLSE